MAECRPQVHPEDVLVELDPNIDLALAYKMFVEQGAQNVTKTKYPSTNISSSTIKFDSINPPSSANIVDRRVYVRFPFRLVLTGTGVAAGSWLLNVVNSVPATGAGDLSGGVDALRAFPLNQALQTVTVTMNNSSFNQNINHYIEPLLRYSNYRDVGETNYSGTPNMQDTYQQYSDFIKYGSARNALGQHGENGYLSPRAGFSGIRVISQNIQGGAAGSVSTGPADIMVSVVDCEVIEPIFLSPLSFGKKSFKGFYGLSTMTVSLTFDPNSTNYLWSHDAVSSGITISSITLDVLNNQTFQNRPEIEFTYYTPRPDQIADIPKTLYYPYHAIHDFPFTQNSSLPPLGETTVQVNTLQLNSIPKLIYIYFRKQTADKTFNDTDTYARIKSINVSFSNQHGLLSDASEHQLYEMSVENGLELSWSDWTKYTGSVLSIDLARQLSMNCGDYVGKTGSFQLQYKITIQNISDNPVTYENYTIVVDQGYISIVDCQINQYPSLGPDVAELHKAEKFHGINFETPFTFYGYGFGDRLRNLGKKIKPVAKKIAKRSASAAYDVAKKYGPKAANLALSEIPGLGPELGVAAETLLERLLNSEITRSEYNQAIENIIGKGMYGGKAVSANQVQRKLKRY